MDDVTLWRFAYGLPIWTTCLVLIVRTVRDWPGIMQRWNERKRDIATATETEKENDWSRLRHEIERLDKRCDHLQAEVDACREREGEWMGRAIQAEAALMGRGRADQEAARMMAEERADPEKASTSRQRFEGNGK